MKRPGFRILFLLALMVNSFPALQEEPSCVVPDRTVIREARCRDPQEPPFRISDILQGCRTEPLDLSFGTDISECL